MATNSTTLRIILEAITKGQKDLERMRQGLEGVGTAAKGASRASDLLGKAWMAVKAIGIGYITREVFQFASGLYETGTAAERARLALEAYTGNSFRAERAIREVQDATDGLVDRLTAAQMATKLFAMGLARNADEAGKLARMAVMLGAAVGKDAMQSFEEFTLLLANQSIQRLDNFGISSARVRERIRELQREMEGLDRQTAFTMAVIEEGTYKLEQLEEAGFRAGHEMDRLKARLRDFYTRGAENFAAGVNGIIDGISGINKALEEQNDSFIMASQGYNDYVMAFLEWKRTLPVYLQVVTEQMSKAEYEQRKLLLDGAQQVDGWAAALTSGMNEVGSSVEDLHQRVYAFRIELGRLSKEIIGRQAINALTEQFNAGLISAREYKNSVYELMTGYLGMSDAEARARIKLSELNAELKSGAVAPEEYAAKAWELVRALDAVPRNIDVRINISTVGTIPHLGSRQKRTIARQHGGPVLPGQPYVVGERGPEVIVPRERGRVEPNPQAAPAQPVNITVYAQGPVSPADLLMALKQAQYTGVLR